MGGGKCGPQREEILENEKATRWRGSHINNRADKRKEKQTWREDTKRQSRKTFCCVCLNACVMFYVCFL